jgi:hypothetical protein
MNSGVGRHSKRVAKPASGWSRHRKWLFAFGGVIVVAAGAIIAFEFAPAAPPVHSSAPAPPLQAVPNPSRPSPAVNPLAAAPITGSLGGDFAQRRVDFTRRPAPS